MLSSYGIDPGEVTKTNIKRVLLSDPTSATSYASLLQDSRFTALASAFNFDSDGYPQGVMQVQTANAAKNTIARYTDTLGDLKTDQTLGKAESQYYDQTILTISSVDELLKNQRLKAYIVKAYGLGNDDISNETLRRVLTSDPLDRRSFVNKSNNAGYKALAADFNFNSDGTVARSEVGVAQNTDDLVRTYGLYYRQTVEEDAGRQNEGVRLALYFERKASSITSAFSILADKALLQVAQTRARPAGDHVAPGHRPSGGDDQRPHRHRGLQGPREDAVVPDALLSDVGREQFERRHVDIAGGAAHHAANRISSSASICSPACRT